MTSLFVCLYFNISFAQLEIIDATQKNDIIIGGADWTEISYSLGDVQVIPFSDGANTTVTFNHQFGRKGTINNNELTHYSSIKGNLTIAKDQTVTIEESSVLVVDGNLEIEGTLQYNNSNGNSKHVYLIVLGNITGGGEIKGGDSNHDQPPYASGKIEIEGGHKGGEGENIDSLPPYISEKLKDDGFDLPVELVSFSASILEEGIAIKWTTASEINASHFEVYSSIDKRNWEILGRVEANGNSNTLIHYSFIDTKKTYNTEVYYKLVQYDFDTRSETFGPLVVSPITEQNTLKTSIFPNPAESGNVTLHISGINLGNRTEIKIFNKEGRLVFSKSMNDDSQLSISYPLHLESSLVPGLYIIRVNSGRQQSIEKLIIR